MDENTHSPVLRHERRPRIAAAKPVPGAPDPRWHLLDLVRLCRGRLGLRDRDLAVLRGLLGFVPPSAGRSHLVVFASNRLLCERCDGIDERTLRRRILHLERLGLLRRQPSPNGKRYQVRDAAAQVRLAYGIDLAPLFLREQQLQTLAEECRQEALQRRSLRAMIRDHLFRFPQSGTPELREEARLSLRRTIDSPALQNLLSELQQDIPNARPTAEELSASDSQNDRHIQSPDKESEQAATSPPACDRASQTPNTVKDISVGECMEMAQTSRSLALRQPRSWEDVSALSVALSPAIGIPEPLRCAAERQLGRHGSALAVLGLVEAFERIRNPAGYLQSLIERAAQRQLDPVRMFRSLVRTGNSPAPCPG